ncbi:MAG: acyltransferase [Aurantimonas coralicida]
MPVNWLKQLVGAKIESEVPARLLDTAHELLADDSFVKSMAQRLMNTPTVWGDPERVSVGNNVHLVNTLLNVSSGRISIGDHTFFGHNVSVLTGTHYIDKDGPERQLYPTDGRDIVIGSSVWIASGATVLGPCTIGDRAVIAAGAVVRGDVEAGAVYAGVPARRIASV